jgi:hypothetical protein
MQNGKNIVVLFIADINGKSGFAITNRLLPSLIET